MDAFQLDRILFVYTILLGLTVGSFLNVVIARLPEGLSVVRPRSRCPRCLTPIGWYENIPVVSWALQRGRCRHCGVPISPRYVMVELLMAFIAAALYVELGGWGYGLAVWFPLSAILLAIVFIDLDYWLIPDRLVIPGTLIALLGAFLPGGMGAFGVLLGLLPATLIFAVAYTFEKITGREGLGLGDVKLLVLLGVAMGLMPTLSLLFLASIQGTVAGIITASFGGHRDAYATMPPHVLDVVDDDPELHWEPPPRAIPFGPFLALSAFEIVLLPDVFAEIPSRLVFMLAESLL